MARPKLEDQVIDLNTIDQLNKSIDLGEKHNYRFEDGSHINITSDLASRIKAKLLIKKPVERANLVEHMMKSKQSFAVVLSQLI